MIGSYSPPVVSRRVHVLFTLFVFVVSNTYCYLFLFCFFFAMLTISLDCPFFIAPLVFSNVYLKSSSSLTPPSTTGWDYPHTTWKQLNWLLKLLLHYISQSPIINSTDLTLNFLFSLWKKSSHMANHPYIKILWHVKHPYWHIGTVVVVVVW